ncbi:MAG: NADH-quinone oxidoreductase subunit C [bacterium]
MGQENILSTIREAQGDKILEVVEKSPRQTFVSVSPEAVCDFNRYLFERMGGRLVTASGVDARDGVEILYHFCFDSLGRTITVKTKVPKPDLKVRSTASFLPAAEWIEREIHDLLGVEFEGHPNLKRLILADDWPEGVYPLRKDQRQLEK